MFHRTIEYAITLLLSPICVCLCVAMCSSIIIAHIKGLTLSSENNMVVNVTFQIVVVVFEPCP